MVCATLVGALAVTVIALALAQTRGATANATHPRLLRRDLGVTQLGVSVAAGEALTIPRVIKTIPLQQDFYSRIAANPATGYVYALDLVSDTAVVISGTSVITMVDVGDWPYDVAANPVTGYVYVANRGAESVTVISGTRVITTLPTGDYPRAIGVNPATGCVYVLNYWSNDVTVISGTSVVTTVAVGVWPYRVAANRATGYVYITNEGGLGDGSITVVSATRVITEIPGRGTPRLVGLSEATGYVYVYDDGIRILSGTRVITSLPRVSGFVQAIGADPTTGYVYLSHSELTLNSCTFSVTVMSGTQVITTLPLGRRVPSGTVYFKRDSVGVDPSTGFVYVVDVISHHVTALVDTSVLAVVQTDSFPWAVDYNPTNGYAYVASSDSVTVIGPVVLGRRVYLPLVARNGS